MKSFYILPSSITPLRLMKWFVLAFIFWIGWLILSPYPHYLPPDFEYDGFLSNKADFFYRSGYFLGFYAHIVGAPIGLFVGGMQMSRTIRLRAIGLHRIAGRVYVGVVLCAAAPGGLVMSTKAFGGWSTTICFGAIALGTWLTTYLGWRAAKRYQIDQHRDWMIRSYLLMLSAVFLRLGYYTLLVLDLPLHTTYQWAAWLSWILPLALFESIRWRLNRSTVPSSFVQN